MSELEAMIAPILRPGTSDADEFQLPVPGLFADMELGRGSVQLPDEFRHGNALVKLQILRDWQRSLLRYRHDTMRQFAQELSRGCPEMSAGERMAMLRSTCESL
ncbi:MAG: hypothetical protein ACRC2B_15725, partial [Rubrivivax sp.]